MVEDQGINVPGIENLVKKLGILVRKLYIYLLISSLKKWVGVSLGSLLEFLELMSEIFLVAASCKWPSKLKT